MLGLLIRQYSSTKPLPPLQTGTASSSSPTPISGYVTKLSNFQENYVEPEDIR